MMNRLQYLLTKLAEEASEVSQIALKCQQFGIHEIKDGILDTNAQRAHQELDDLMAIVGMLNDEFGFGYDPSLERIEAKKEKVERYFRLSAERNQVDPDAIADLGAPR